MRELEKGVKKMLGYSDFSSSNHGLWTLKIKVTQPSYLLYKYIHVPMKSCKTENPTVLRPELGPVQDIRNFPVTLRGSTEAKKEIIAEETMEAIIK